MNNPNANFFESGQGGNPSGTISYPATLNASFSPTQKGTKVTPVVTSNVAKDHITNMGATIDQANKDIASSGMANASNSAMKTQKEDAQKQQDIENKQKMDPTQMLMSALGEDSIVGSDTINANKEANALDKTRLQEVSGIIDKMNAGTYPLSTTEQASVNNLRGQFTSAFEEADRVLKNKKGGTELMNAKRGLQMYSPTEAISNMAKTVKEGNDRVAEINTKLLDSQNKLTQAFKDQDFKTATSLYNRISDTIKERNDEINTLNKSIADQRKELMDYVKDEQKRQDDVEKELTKSKSDILIKLGESGNKVSPEVLAGVQAAGSVGEALAIAGDMLYSEDDKLDAQYKKLQMDKMRQDMVLDVQKFNLDKLKDEQGNTLDPNMAVAYAAEYAANGKIPTGLPKNTFGEIAKIAKEMPKSPGQVVSVSTGVAPAGDDAFQTALSSLYSATQLAKQLKELDKKRWDGVISGSVGKVFGAEDQQKYIDLRSQIVDLLSRARSGAALTPSEEARYSEMLPGRFSTTLGFGTDPQLKIDNFISALTGDAQNKASAKGWAINGVSKVKAGGNEYTVGDVIDINGTQGRINADGTITQL